MKRVYNYLGLAQRAGRVVSGEQALEVTLAKRRVFLMLIASDASSNTYNKFKSLAQKHDVEYFVFGEKERLGHAIGKSPRAVVGVIDRNFANVIGKEIVGSVLEKNKE